MGRQILWLFLIILMILSISVAPEAASNRTALVIGNSSYKSSPLNNPVNDATDMAAILNSRGFNVTLKINATQKTMERSIRNFGKTLKSGGMGLFYYAGHGIQVKGNNYLIPIGSIIESEGDVKYEAVNAGLVLSKMEDAGNNLNIVILDACRNNPFARNFRSSTSGLARMDAPKGTLIAYATAPGSLASDGKGRNGIYTKHLIRNIKRSQIKVEQVFKNVRVAVVSETSSKQIPWEASSLMGTFYFTPQQTEQKDIKQAVEKKQPADNSYELLFWESIKDSEDVKMFEAYLIKFPLGMFSELAEINIQKYRTTSDLKQIPQILKNDIQEKPVQVASISPTDKGPAIIARDGQYIKYSNNIVYDKKSGLEWLAGPDKDTLGYAAKSWVEELTLDGGRWRMPARSELKGLYKSGAGKRNMTPLFETTGWFVWSSVGGGFFFSSYYWGFGSYQGNSPRAFAVRSRR